MISLVTGSARRPPRADAVRGAVFLWATEGMLPGYTGYARRLKSARTDRTWLPHRRCVLGRPCRGERRRYGQATFDFTDMKSSEGRSANPRFVYSHQEYNQRGPVRQLQGGLP